MDLDNITRPKAGDTEADLIHMQEEYFKEKQGRNSQLQSPTRAETSGQKQSVFAKSRNVKQSEKTDKKQKQNEVIGDVVERKYESLTMDSDPDEIDNDQGFPKPKPIDNRSMRESNEKSIFGQVTLGKKRTSGEPSKTHSDSSQDVSSDLKASVHEENLLNINSMSEKDIIEEQKNIKATMDPNMLEFIKKRRSNNQSAPHIETASNPGPSNLDQNSLPLDVSTAANLLNQASANQWMNFDIFEPEKLEWTRDMKLRVAEIKSKEAYEARFDFDGMLQPFSAEMTEKNRHLFMHGGPDNRIGLTLQDFFRLSRSNTLQQRIAGINAIGGILSIYNQGYYDGVFEIPISKIFFLLRFAMDENIPSVIEAASRALSNLFYNESDETMLDFLYETRNGLFQPIMNNKRASVIATTVDEPCVDLEEMVKKLNLTERKSSEQMERETNEDAEDFDDEEETSLHKDDYHWAETDLVKCFTKSNIINRIIYIFTTTSPSAVTVNACVKILIRLARANRENGLNILTTVTTTGVSFGNLLIEKFLPSIECGKTIYTIVLKLFRVIASFDRDLLKEVINLGVIDIVERYINTRQDLSNDIIFIQLESFRLLRLYFFATKDHKKFKSLVDSLSYYLNFAYHKLEIEMPKFAFYRQHVSALLRLIDMGSTALTLLSFSDMLRQCLCKWFEMVNRHKINEFTQRLLLAAILDLEAKFVRCSAINFIDFTKKYFKPFLKSVDLLRVISNLADSSHLLKSTTDRCNAHKPLLNIGSIVRCNESSLPSHILSHEYSINLLAAICNFIEGFKSEEIALNRITYSDLCEAFYPRFENYLERFSKNINRKICTNWFLKEETSFVLNLLNSSYLQFNDFNINVAFNVVSHCTYEKVYQIRMLFDNIVFTARYYDVCHISDAELLRYNAIYSAIVRGKLEDHDPQKPIKLAVHDNWNQIVLGEAWPYSPLLLLLYNEDQDTSTKKTVETDVKELEIIKTAMSFTLMLEDSKINVISDNQKLIYLMLVFFGNESEFLHKDVKALLTKKFKRMKGVSYPPRFNFKLNKEKSFESLYMMFLNIFKSKSYNDNLFSVLVMVPLAQKYDIKWRKLIWSEYLDAMRCIGCKEADLIDNIDEYLNPVETDQSLLKNYADAIASNQLIENSIPHKIAMHHLMEAQKRSK